MNRLLMVMVVLALGAVLAACGTADDPEVPPPTSTELPASATDAPSEAPLNATEILAHTQEMMDSRASGAVSPLHLRGPCQRSPILQASLSFKTWAAIGLHSSQVDPIIRTAVRLK